MSLEIECCFLTAAGGIAQCVHTTVNQFHGNTLAALYVDGSTSVRIGQRHASQLQRQFIVAVNGQRAIRRVSFYLISILLIGRIRGDGDVGAIHGIHDIRNATGNIDSSRRTPILYLNDILG